MSSSICDFKPIKNIYTINIDRANIPYQIYSIYPILRYQPQKMEDKDDHIMISLKLPDYTNVQNVQIMTCTENKLNYLIDV